MPEFVKAVPNAEDMANRARANRWMCGWRRLGAGGTIATGRKGGDEAPLFAGEWTSTRHDVLERRLVVDLPEQPRFRGNLQMEAIGRAFDKNVSAEIRVNLEIRVGEASGKSQRGALIKTTASHSLAVTMPLTFFLW